jgi:peptidoglycan/LPS O-acetylase OafA/YrhL
LLFPALLIFARRYGAWYAPAVIASLACLRAVVWFLNGVAHDSAYFSIFGALDIFLIGMLAGNFYMQPRRWQLPGWVVLLAFVVLNIAIYAAHLHRSFFNYDFDHVTTDGVSRSALWIIWPTVQGLLFAAFALIYLLSRWQVPFAGAFAYLGKISYSLYVWHSIVFLAAMRLRLRFLPPFEMGLFVILPATVAISALSYKLIEEPFLGMRVRYVRQRVAVENVPTE